MNAIDLTPLYRNSVGFDRFASLLDRALHSENIANNYPPYDIDIVDDQEYRITLAVAGFKRDELDISVERGVLSVRGKKAQKSQKNYLYQGISQRGFERKFNLADYVEVRGADLSDGLLTIHLVKELPEEMKPKSIPIQQGELLSHEPAKITHQRTTEPEKEKVA